MATVSSPFWSLFLATRGNSSSLIHIKLDKTSFLVDLVFLKTNRVHIFLFYFWFKIFPVLLLVLILISRFNFIFVWFNLGFLWSIAGGISNRGAIKTIRTPCEIFVGHAKSMKNFAWGAKFSHGVWNFAQLANQFHTPIENQNTLQNHFNPYAKFSQTVRKIS